MWAQQWGGIIDLVKPYPDIQALDVTKLLVDNGYTPMKMFKVTRAVCYFYFN